MVLHNSKLNSLNTKQPWELNTYSIKTENILAILFWKDDIFMSIDLRQELWEMPAYHLKGLHLLIIWLQSNLKCS